MVKKDQWSIGKVLIKGNRSHNIKESFWKRLRLIESERRGDRFLERLDIKLRKGDSKL